MHQIIVLHQFLLHLVCSIRPDFKCSFKYYGSDWFSLLQRYTKYNKSAYAKEYKYTLPKTRLYFFTIIELIFLSFTYIFIHVIFEDIDEFLQY